MRSDNAVPDVQVLKRFLLGQLSREEAEPIERYLEQHPDIASTLAELVKEDTLVGSLRASGGQPVVDPPELAGLMDKLSQLRSAGDDATVGLPNGASSDGDALAGLAPPQAPGEIGRLGGYRVLKVLGAGGMGMVYHGEDVHLQRPVALKVMKPDVAKNASARERFLREARAAAKLHSDHVVNIYQVGEDNQVVFLAMEFLEGMSLDDWLKKGRTPTLTQAARIGRQIALGLADAHACGLIHRDIKPGNVWLDSRHQGRAKLLDFGLARGDADEIHLTQSGAIVGTPAYMAPEQARGEHVDHRVDLFSLGVVLYRLATGQLPFRGDNTMSVLTSLALDTPKAPREVNPDIPPRMAALIDGLLSKDREQRPATARVVADELAAIEREQTPAGVPLAAVPSLDDRTIESEVKDVRAASVSEPVCLPARSRSRLGKYIVAAGLLLVLGGVAAAVVVIIRDRNNKEVARVIVPDGGSAVIEDDAKDKDEAKVKPALKEGVRLVGGPLAPLLPGEPLSPSALVQQPAKLPGVRSWTIETRAPLVPYAPVLAYRPDGKRLAAGKMDGVIRIFEPNTGRLVQVLLGEGRPYALAWSPDGRGLAAVIEGQKRLVRLWDAETGRVLWAIDVPGQDTVSAFAWSPDGRSVLLCAASSLAVDATRGKITRQAPLPCAGGAFSPDGKRVAGVPRQMDGLFVWAADTGEVVRKLGEHVGAVSWSPDGKRLASVWVDALRVWEVETGKEILQRKDLASKGRGSVSWSPDGRTLALTHESEQRARLVEVTADAKPLEVDGPHEEMAWSPDGKTIALAEASLQIHDVATGKQLRSLWEPREGPGIDGFALSPDGQTLAMRAGGQQTFLSSMDTGQIFLKLEGTMGPLAWSPDGKRLATAGPNHVVILWEDGGKTRIALSGHQQDVNWLAWSSDGKRLASSSAGEKRVLLWDADKGEQFREIGPFPAAAESLSWSPDGRLVAFYVPGHNWHIWDIEQNRLVNDPKQWLIARFAFAPDSRSALTLGSPGDDYRLRELSTFKERAHIPSSPDPFNLRPTPLWSLDGRLLAVQAGPDVQLWRGDLSGRVRTLRGSLSYIRDVAFSADGKLVMGLAYPRLHIWETDTGRLRGIQLLGERNNSLTITPDGHYTGNEQVERGIVMVVQKDDGTQEVLEPADFEQKYGFKNEPEKVHLLQPLPPSLTVPEGQPMGPHALVREPAELPDANSWTVETRNARGTVKAVVYRPDGKLLATGGDDGTIRIWNTSSGEQVRMLVGDPVSSLSWSKDGKILAASGVYTARLWDVDTGRLLRRIPNTSVLAWSPHDRSLALMVNDELRVWDAATERDVPSYRFTPLPGHRAIGLSLAWSPDGKTLAVILEDSTVRLWDVASGKESRKWEDKWLGGVAWSPDGKWLATGADGGNAFRVWDAATGKLKGRFATGGVRAVAWSPDGKAVAAGSGGLYDPETGLLLRSWKAGQVVEAIAWSPDGKQVATADSILGVRLHDAASGKRTHTLEEGNAPQRIHSVTWSPDNQRLALGYSTADPLLVVEAATGQHRPSPADGLYGATWSPDGKMLAAMTSDRTVRVWDTVTIRPVRTLEGTVGAPFEMAWTADGKKLAGGNDRTVWVWSVETGKLLWQNAKHQRFRNVAWLLDGRCLATTDDGDKGAVRIWDAETGKLLHETPLRSYLVAWSPDGKTLAVVSQEAGSPIVALIDSTSATVRVKVQGGLPRWSPDSKTLDTVDVNPEAAHVRIWEAVSGKQFLSARLPWTFSGISATAWSPDGQRLARSTGYEIHLCHREGHTLGMLLPYDDFGQLAVTAEGHYRGNARLERAIRMVVQKRDGSSETLTPSEFEQKYGFKNDPAKVRLTDK